MGLDWEPLARPRPEHADEFATLLARLQATGDETVLDRMNAIAIQPFETLAAPRVGYDIAADDWLRGRIANEDEIYDSLIKMQGYYVLELLPAYDGFPVYANEGAHRRYSFRGATLAEARRELGTLYDEAFRYRSGEQLEDFGERVMSCARRFARRHRIMEIELVREARYPRQSAESRAHVMFAAARWCLFWARRGHGLAPY